MARPVWVEVDLSAIKDNVRNIKAFISSPTALMAVVKANAYGHGLVPVAKAAVDSGAERLGVALVEEAAELRQAGINVPIQLLSEPPAETAPLIVRDNLIPAVYSINLAQALSRAAEAAGTQIIIHLKADTGMHRVGIAAGNVVEFHRAISHLPGLRIEGIFTHFACADNPRDPFTARQLKIFLDLKKNLPGVSIWHAANSAGALFMPQSHLDMVRIGIAMYGLEPSATPGPIPLKPALSLKTKISWTQELGPGEGVSYGLTYKAQRQVKVATLPIGYGDGYSRLLSNQGKVLINGQRVNIVGSICMDQLLIELGEAGGAPGDEVVLIGKQNGERISAEELASLIGTINYEIVCMINGRVPRIYVN